jgi:aminopeptidase N
MTLAERFARLKRKPESDPLWSFAPAAIPKAADLFATPVYARGAMTLEALREKVGTSTFLSILRDWAAANEYGNADTADFIALAQSRSRKDLAKLFQRWLFNSGKP